MVLKTGFSRGSDVTPIYSYDKALVREGWDILEKAQNNNEPVEGIILGSNKGGAMIDIKGVQGFIPSSQLMSFFVPDENVEDSSVEIDVTGRKNLEKNVNSKISVKVLEVDQTRNRAILSERALMQELKDKAKQQVDFWLLYPNFYAIMKLILTEPYILGTIFDAIRLIAVS